MAAQLTGTGAWAKDAAATEFDLPRLEQHMLRSAARSYYRIVIARPSGPAPVKGYPVIYVMDGNAWTVIVSEIIRVNGAFGVISKVEPAVVVGIGYPTADAFDIKRRSYDLVPPTPVDSPDLKSGDVEKVGGDDAMRDFIDSIVKPFVERRFPIDKERQTLMGHSLGGLFALQTLFTRPKSFQTYIALSPSIWWNQRAILQDARRFEASPDRPRNVRVFLSTGDLEQHYTPEYLEREHAEERRYAVANPKKLAGKTVDEWLAQMDRY